MTVENESAEWGARTLKGPFARLTVTIPTDAYQRKRILVTTVQLRNLRVRRVGLNQIRTVYANEGSEVEQ